jgi:hypothetical protein
MYDPEHVDALIAERDRLRAELDEARHRITKLEGAFEVAASSRDTWRARAFDAGWAPGASR